LALVGSLKLAIGLLCLFTACLALGTLVEARCGAAIGQEVVYRSWWFCLLLALLAVNVLGAALKKYPWQRYQTGFLVTHAGLLVLLLGGLLTAVGGVDGQMLLLDTENADIQRYFSLPHQGDRIQLAGRHQLELCRFPRSAVHDATTLEVMQALDRGEELPERLRDRLRGQYWSLGFSPGSFAWHGDEHFQPEYPAALRLLRLLADPWPGFSQGLDERTTLAVNNYYPHTEHWPYSKTSDPDGFPALKLRLTSAVAGRPLERWVVGLPHFEREPSPICCEVMTLPEPALLPEFLDPPPPAAMGKQGLLVLLVGPEKKAFRLPVDKDRLGKDIDLPGTGLRLVLNKCGDIVEFVRSGVAPAAESPRNPTVHFELSGPAGRGEYLACARLPDVPLLRYGVGPEQLAAWYHYPDFRGGDAHLMGALQFLQAPDGKVYFRVYGKDGLRQKGQELHVADPTRVYELPWKPMEMKFQVAGYLPRATEDPSCVPRMVRPGAEPADHLKPAVRCTLTVGGKAAEFWARLSRRATRLQVGDNFFLIRYRQDSRPVDFALTLKQARQVTDPGTERAGSFQSDVTLTRTRDGKSESTDHAIAMNNPLRHGRYKVYQTNYRPMVDPDTFDLVLDPAGRLVSLSGLTVAYDPGLYCKYAGSFMVVLGIATMFLMRAYFFKPQITRISRMVAK
jgi:hypothetical protein